MRKLSQNGFTMVEMMITMALTAFMGAMVYSVVQWADKEANAETESLLGMIQRLGSAKVIARDIANSSPSLNYINMADDNGRPFFVFPNREFCLNANCARTFTMKIQTGQTVSEPLFLISTYGLTNEILSLGVDSLSTFDTSGTFIGVNWENSVDASLGINKSIIPSSPWIKGRLFMLESMNTFYDCESSTQLYTVGTLGSCDTKGPPAGVITYSAGRPLKLLGSVNVDEKDMTYTPVKNRSDLLKTKYQICRPGPNGVCTVTSKYSGGLHIKSSQHFFENMPFIPGSDNQANLVPVELIRYHLERPTPSSPDSKIVLIRSAATIVGGELSFERGHLLMTGIQSIVFTRPNISNSTIDYRFINARK